MSQQPQPIIEPDFEGEEMKIPEGVAQVKTPTAPTKSIIGTTVIIFLTIVLIAIFVGLGYWYKLVMSTPIVDTTSNNPTFETDTTNDNISSETSSEISTSDEIQAIEADLENTNLGTLDQELNEIDAELEAEIGVQ